MSFLCSTSYVKWTPLMHASYHGDQLKVRKLLEEDVDHHKALDYFGRNAFYLANLANRFSILKEYWKEDAFDITDINKTDKFGNTLLMKVCKRGDKKFVHRLLKLNGLATNVSNVDGETALAIACKFQSVDIIQALLKHIGFQKLCEIGDFRTISALLDQVKNGVITLDINAEDSNGMTGLDLALRQKRTEIVKLLCKKLLN